MSYIVIRNRDHGHAFTARTVDATLKQGMVVKFAGETANGTLTVAKPTAAELADPTVQKGVVWYREKLDNVVDFEMSPSDPTVMTVIEKLIPNDAQVTVYTGRLVVAYHKTLLPAGLVAAAVRSKVAFDADTALPAVYNSASTDGTEKAVGFLERKDGPEYTLVLNV